MSSTDTVTWADCVGDATWIAEPLQATLSYPNPLPVQQAVIPTVSRALLSGIPMDVSLTAPTGSGKTLCYLLPMLRLVTQEKKGLNDTRLRAVVLVPSAPLGQQVFREISRLTRHTTIAVASLCGGGGESMAKEADTLVRRVRGGGAATTAGGDDHGNSTAMMLHLLHGNGTSNSTGGDDVSNANTNSVAACHYFSKVDVLVTTPQRLLRHLDSTRGLSLASLRLLVIDEADQVLAGNFANFVVKVVERFEEEQAALAAGELRSKRGGGAVTTTTTTTTTTSGNSHTLHKMLCSATLSSRIGRISEVRLRNCQYYALDTNGTEMPQDNTNSNTNNAGTTITLSSSSSGGPQQVIKTAFALPPFLHEHIVFVEDRYRHAVLLKLVRSLIARIEAQQSARREQQRLLREREINGDDDENDEKGNGDEKEKGNGVVAATTDDATSSSGGSPGKKRLQRSDAGGGGAAQPSASAAALEYPSVSDDAGNGILVFCSSAEEARVMGHFLSAAGVQGVIEFTTLTTESERRRALLQGGSDSSSSSSSYSAQQQQRPSVIVASDALMRGIDIPSTGHIIMYHPPESISQYVHRAGRTARAMRSGHLHILLSKLGPSGTQEDGEVAAFRRLGQMVSRTVAARYERHFFLFSEAPVPAAAAAAPAEKKRKLEAPAAVAVAVAVATTAAAALVGEEGAEINSATDDATATTATATTTAAVGLVVDPKDSAEWWIAEADRYLDRSQETLRVKWGSVLETAASTSAATKKDK